MKILKKIVPRLHLKVSPFFNKCISFFDKKNVTVTKKYILSNLIFSLPVAILLFNIICFSKIFIIYMATINPISFDINLRIFMSIASFILTIAIYGFFVCNTKSLFVSFVGSGFIKILSVVASLIVISIALQSFNFIIFFFIVLINLVAIMTVFINNRKFTEHVHNFKSINKFKLIFVDVDNFDRIVTFLNNMNVFYHRNHVVINGYKLSYQDVSVFEDQFNKKLYDFNQDELNVVTMYSIQ